MSRFRPCGPVCSHSSSPGRSCSSRSSLPGSRRASSSWVRLHTTPVTRACSAGSGWYDRIAAHGYENLGNSALRFFPLLPVLARSLRAVPGTTAGMSVIIVANLACLAAFAALYRLVVVELGDEACARRAVWLLALAPTAFVLVMGYAESLLLLTSLVTFLGLRQRRYGLAICAGFAAGLCRPVGMLLAIPALIEVATSWRALSSRQRLIGAGAVLAAPAGAAAYLGWTQEVVGSFLLPLREQLSRARRGAAADPFVTFARDARPRTPHAPRHGGARLLGSRAGCAGGVRPSSAPGRLRLVHRRRARGCADRLQPRVHSSATRWAVSRSSWRRRCSPSAAGVSEWSLLCRAHCSSLTPCWPFSASTCPELQVARPWMSRSGPPVR